MDIQSEINYYLEQAIDGKSKMSDKILDKFAERCRAAMDSQFNSEEDEFKIRMSSIGKPLCQQQLEKEGANAERPNPSLKMKFAFGDIVEAMTMAVMEAAEVSIEAFQQEVEYKLGTENIKGTLDVIIDNKVYDIKSASGFQFKKKFSKEDGFQRILQDDPFGYVSQGYLYGEASNKPFGGWIAVNKETGEIAVCPTPERGDAYKRKAVGDARKNVTALVNDEPFERCFGPEPDTYYNKPTGDNRLNVVCSYCKFKQTCWAGEIEFRKSKKGSSYKWYFKG